MRDREAVPYVMTQEVAAQFQKALGLEGIPMRKLVITLEAGRPVHVAIEMLAPRPAGGVLLEGMPKAQPVEMLLKKVDE